MVKNFDQPIKNNEVTYENIRKIRQAKEMTIQLVVCYIIHILQILIK